MVTGWFICISEGSPKISGGQAATLGQFPYQAALVVGGAFRCAGSLIGTTWILTAAHCLLPA
jgi:secreted trypsin-like serine protease